LLAAIAWNRRSDAQWKVAWIVSLFGLLYSLYLTSISLFELRAACPYCLSSLVLMTAIFVTVAMQKPNNIAKFSWGPWLAKTAGPALVVVLALHLHYAGYWGKTAGPEDPWIRGLAEHLAKINAKFYGASWCPHCKEQKEMFGSSMKRVPYVECSPGGPGTPQAAVCNSAGVESYPTWLINGQRYVGTQTLEGLAQFSQYKGEGAVQ
jgi:glutaredoxin